MLFHVVGAVYGIVDAASVSCACCVVFDVLGAMSRIVDVKSVSCCCFAIQVKSSGSRVNMVAMTRHDTETLFQQIKEQGMTGKGWIWIASDAAAMSNFYTSKSLQGAMDGIVGTLPKGKTRPTYSLYQKPFMK